MTRTTPILTTVLLSLVIPLAACSVDEEKDAGAGASGLPAQDAGVALTTTVEQAWSADPEIPGYLLAAKMRDGKLQLFGTVESAAQRDAAVATAKKLAGDTPVVAHIEITRIASLEGTPVPGAGPAAVPPQDEAAALAVTVEEAWMANGKIPYELVAAKLRKGKLELFGAVETAEQHALAVRIAKEQAAPTPVVDHIAVKKVTSLAP